MILMQAIRTRYLGPTNTRPARIRASCNAGSLTLSYEDMLGSDANHKAAAVALRDHLGWFNMGVMSGGSFKQDGYWVFTPAEEALVAAGASVMAAGNLQNFIDNADVDDKWPEFGLEEEVAQAYLANHLDDIVLVAGAIQKQLNP